MVSDAHSTHPLQLDTRTSIPISSNHDTTQTQTHTLTQIDTAAAAPASTSVLAQRTRAHKHGHGHGSRSEHSSSHDSGHRKHVGSNDNDRHDDEIDWESEGLGDEPHERAIREMYGHHIWGRDHRQQQQQGSTSSGQTQPGGRIQPDERNPNSFPGMSPNESPQEWDYAITIDCGSSGSRLHIYKWKHRHSPSSIPPFTPLFTKHAWTMHVEPGINSFVRDPDRTILHLRALLEFAKNSLSQWRSKWDRIPLYVKATAGMRLIKNLPSRDRIMQTIRDYLSDATRNPFYFERSMARVISGEEEGVYGWMTTNYLMGTLMHATSQTSYGTLDMGGASVQITFRPPFDVLSNYFPLRLQQEKIRLYTHSFLNFGIGAAYQRVNDRIIELGNITANELGEHTHKESTRLATVPTTALHSISSSPSSSHSHSSSHSSHSSSSSYSTPHKHHRDDDRDHDDEGYDEEENDFFLGYRDGVRVFRHPCLPLGFTSTYEYVVNSDLAASFRGARMRAPGEEDDGEDMSPITTYNEANSRREMVVFQGSQHLARCSKLTWGLLHKKAPCFDNTCSFNGIYQPRFGNTTFLAFSEFGKIVLEQLKLTPDASLKEIDHKSHEVCHMTWQQLQDAYPYEKIDTLSKLCFHARYIFTVLYKGFGFPYDPSTQNSTYNRGKLRFVRSLMDLDLSWALGSTLYEANAMPWDIDRTMQGEAEMYSIMKRQQLKAEEKENDDDDDHDGSSRHGRKHRESHHGHDHSSSSHHRHHHGHSSRSDSDATRRRIIEDNGQGNGAGWEQQQQQQQDQIQQREDDAELQPSLASQHIVDTMPPPPSQTPMQSQPQPFDSPSYQPYQNTAPPTWDQQSQPQQQQQQQPGQSSQSSPQPNRRRKARIKQSVRTFRIEWALLGFTTGGWIVTLIAAYLLTHHLRAQIRRLESQALPYEPIRNS